MNSRKVLGALLICMVGAALAASVGLAQPDSRRDEAPGDRGRDIDRPGRSPGPRGPGRGKGTMGFLRTPVNPEQYAERMGRLLGLVQHMNQTAFDPQVAGLVALGGLRTDVQRELDEIVKDFEGLLATTKTLGLRNSIRLTLRDLYKETGRNEKVLENLRAMLAENDAAIAEIEKAGPRPVTPGP